MPRLRATTVVAGNANAGKLNRSQREIANAGGNTTMHADEEFEELPRNAHASARQLRFPARHEQYPRQAAALIVGTPEHTALVAALKENFPEIYETN